MAPSSISAALVDAGGGLAWVDRDGTITPLDSTLTGSFINLALSPDARQLALTVTRPGGSEVWIKHLVTGAFSRLSIDLLNADRPSWTADGRYVTFLGKARNQRTAWIRRADGSDSRRKIDPGPRTYDEVATSKAITVSTLFRTEGSAVGTRHLLVREEGVDTAPRPLVVSKYDTYAMALSPDSRWLAYVSNESGRPEVYVRPFPNVDSAKFAISTAGGVEPLWRRDGRELFYRDIRGGVFSVKLGAGPAFKHDAPALLFIRPEMSTAAYSRTWDIAPDGQRFLMVRSGGTTATAIAVVFNWPPAGLPGGARE